MNRRLLAAASVAGAVALVLALALVRAGVPLAAPAVSPPDGHVLAALMRSRHARDDAGMAWAWLAMSDPLRAADALGGVTMQGRARAVLRLAADIAIQTSRWGEAQIAFERLLEAEPDNPYAHLSLGLMLAAAYPNAAHTHLQAAVAEPALAPLARAVLIAIDQSAGAVGWELLEQEQWPYAELALSIAAAGPAPHPIILGALALAQDHQGRDGSRWLALALEAAPEDVSLLAMAGMHLRLRGDLEGSLLAFSAAAVLAPESAPILAQLGVAYQRAGDLGQARAWLEQAVTLAGDDPRYQALLDAATDTEEAALDALVDALDSGAAYGAP